MFVQWASAGGSPGAFAIRGILPYVFVSPHRCAPSYSSFLWFRYLQNGNILAARTFIKHLTSAVLKTQNLESPYPPLTVGSDEVILTKDPVLNFAQMAVLTCQRANGENNKVMRESWVRLCGTYQNKGGVLTLPEVRKVRLGVVQSLETDERFYICRFCKKLRRCTLRSHLQGDSLPIRLATCCPRCSVVDQGLLHREC